MNSIMKINDIKIILDHFTNDICPYCHTLLEISMKKNCACYEYEIKAENYLAEIHRIIMGKEKEGEYRKITDF